MKHFFSSQPQKYTLFYIMYSLKVAQKTLFRYNKNINLIQKKIVNIYILLIAVANSDKKL